MTTPEIATIILALAAVQALLAWWIQARLTSSIKHEYDRELEEFKRNQLLKDKAAVVAEFLAEWTHIQGTDTKRLNQLLWELSLYLPANLVRDVKSMISNTPNGKTAPQVLVDIRRHLLNAIPTRLKLRTLFISNTLEIHQ
jgi:hypothetical protein